MNEGENKNAAIYICYLRIVKLLFRNYSLNDTKKISNECLFSFLSCKLEKVYGRLDERTRKRVRKQLVVAPEFLSRRGEGGSAPASPPWLRH